MTFLMIIIPFFFLISYFLFILSLVFQSANQKSIVLIVYHLNNVISYCPFYFYFTLFFYLFFFPLFFFFRYTGFVVVQIGTERIP
ncbi:hypothetical protein EDC94DRAFT_617823 [Helicostylum pulchrum]|nr:hypothetical protein EDC94DRAFT_617823 [Helicostylum pulchrum]